MTDPVSSAEFDAWAPDYDQSIIENSGFPFHGYTAVLNTIAEVCTPQPGNSVLDMGIGTGNLSQLFDCRGCKIWGLDFSAEMLALAQLKLPKAMLAQADLRSSWSHDFQRRFDYVVSAYTFHHFMLKEKVRLIRQLLNRSLAPGGKLVIGDIAFANSAEEDLLRRSLGKQWEQEFYWLADKTYSAFNEAGIAVAFKKISPCAGVFQFSSHS
jgi:putative AdoMet-dependent methyltransferase